MKKSILTILLSIILLTACSDDNGIFEPEIDAFGNNNSQYNIYIEHYEPNQTIIGLSTDSTYYDCILLNKQISIDGHQLDIDCQSVSSFEAIYPQNIENGQTINVEISFDRHDVNRNDMYSYIREHYSYQDWRSTAEIMAMTIGRNDATTIDQAEDGDEVFYIADLDNNGWVMDSTVTVNWESFFMLDYEMGEEFFYDVLTYNKYVFGWDDWQAEYQARVIQDFGGSEEAFWEAQLLDAIRYGIDATSGVQFEYEDKDFDFENGYHIAWAQNREQFLGSATSFNGHKEIHFSIKRPCKVQNFNLTEESNNSERITWDIEEESMLQYIRANINHTEISIIYLKTEYLPGNQRFWVRTGSNDVYLASVHLTEINYFINKDQDFTGIYLDYNWSGSLHDRYNHPPQRRKDEHHMEIFKYIYNMEQE